MDEFVYITIHIQIKEEEKHKEEDLTARVQQMKNSALQWKEKCLQARKEVANLKEALATATATATAQTTATPTQQQQPSAEIQAELAQLRKELEETKAALEQKVKENEELTQKTKEDEAEVVFIYRCM